MRYILDPRLKSEAVARREYLLEIFHLYFILQAPCDVVSTLAPSAIILSSFPTTVEDDICIICGHNDFVAKVLQMSATEIPETSIYLITCAHQYINKYYVKGKKVYLIPQEKEYAHTHIGSYFGFKFGITDAELNMYNSREITIRGKLHESFRRL